MSANTCTTAFIFPGQGSQSIGMGLALNEAFPEAKAVFQAVDAALGESLSSLMFSGDADTLTKTMNAQPALMAVSLAALAALEAASGKNLAAHAHYVAGHSLGEYAALAAAGSLSVTDAAKLLRIRGNAMQAAVPVGAGAMAALIGLEFDAVAKLCAETVAALGREAVCEAANDNGGGQVVISGSKAAIDHAMGLAKTLGAKRAILLPVSAPFHCAMMAPAAAVMAQALAGVALKASSVPLIANVTADVVQEPEIITELLVQQVTGTVRWRESILRLGALGVTKFVEVGAGKVLCGLVKRILPEAQCFALGTPQDIEVFLKG